MWAEYLFRFDDICPTMNWKVWDQVESILIKHEIRPILAVVPDNRDRYLEVCSPAKDFWALVRAWRARGWSIGMHGWQHRYVTNDPGLLRINRYSEFAGLPACEQADRLLSGIAVFRANSIPTNVWVAPAHSFDLTTVKLLSQLGFTYISDGCSLFPFADEFGMEWIPQQLWSFRKRLFGVWTICFHINGWQTSDIERFSRMVERYAERISHLESIATRYGGRRKTLFDTAFGLAYRRAAVAKSEMGRLLTSHSHTIAG